MPNVIKLSVLTIAVLGSQFALANEPWSQDRQWLLVTGMVSVNN